MEEMNKDLWFFYNTSTKEKMGPFSMDSLCAFIISNKIEPDQINLAQPDWTKWKKAVDVIEFLKKHKLPPEEAIYNLPLIEELADELEMNEEPPELPPEFLQKAAPAPVISIADTESWENRRKHQRFSIELKAIFIVDKKSFRTKTENLSLGGIKIVDPLPECYFNKKIQIYLSSQDLKFSIKFEANLIQNNKTQTHIKFISQNDLASKHLNAWLQAISQANNPIKKIA